MVAFSIPDTVLLGTINNFSPSNLSLNCSNYFWDFGDGFGESTVFEPNYNYLLSGIYLTKLVGIRNTGCRDSITKNVQVIDFAANVVVRPNKNIQLLDLGNNQMMIKLNQNTFSVLTLNVICIDGREALYKTYDGVSDNVLRDLNNLYTGLYLLQVVSKDRQVYSSKIYVK